MWEGHFRPDSAGSEICRNKVSSTGLTDLWKILFCVALCGVGELVILHSLKPLDCKLLKGRITLLLEPQQYLKGVTEPIGEL